MYVNLEHKTCVNRLGLKGALFFVHISILETDYYILQEKLRVKIYHSSNKAHQSWIERLITLRKSSNSFSSFKKKL